MRQSLVTIAVEDNIFDAFGHARFKSVAQGAHVRRALIHLFNSKASSRAEGDYSRNRFRPGAALALLMPANILCHDSHATTHEESARAFGRIEFVCRERKQIATE